MNTPSSTPNDMAAIPVLVHIGYPKCASSALQSGLFSETSCCFSPLASGTLSHNAPYRKGGENVFFDQREPVARSFSPFAYDIGAGREQVTKHFPLLDDGRVAVLSNEAWTGHPFSGGATADTVAARIKAVLPQARILIVIREQRAMLLSAYAHFLTKGCGLVSLETYLNPKLETQIPWHNPAYFRFSGLIGHYQSIFGKDRVLVLPMEAMVANAHAFQAAICRFAGAAVPDEAVSPRTTNSRDWKEYAVLRHARWLNLLGRSTPANGHIGLNALRLRNAILCLGSALTHSRRLDRLKAADRAQAEAHLISTGIRAENTHLQSLVRDQCSSYVPIELTDLARYGYLVDSEKI